MRVEATDESSPVPEPILFTHTTPAERHWSDDETTVLSRDSVLRHDDQQTMVGIPSVIEAPHVRRSARIDKKFERIMLVIIVALMILVFVTFGVVVVTDVAKLRSVPAVPQVIVGQVAR
jgi:hypothetical protein